MSDIGVKLTGDNADFRSMLNDSVNKGTEFADRISERVGDRLLGLRHISTAVATALGLNLENIAQNIARLYTGMSKDEEEAYKVSDQLNTKLTDLRIKNGKALLSEEQKYQLAIQERDKLQAQIENANAKTQVEKNALIEKQIELENNVAEIQAYELKQNQESKKDFEAESAARYALNEKEQAAALSKLEADEREKKLREDIRGINAAIASGHLDEASAKRFNVTLSERQFELDRTIAEEHAKQKATLQEIGKLKFDALPLDEKILSFQTSIETLTQAIAAAKKQHVNHDSDDLTLLQNQLELNKLLKEQEIERAKTQSKITTEIQAQLDAMNHVNDAEYLNSARASGTTYQFNGVAIGPARDASYFSDLSDTVLQEIVKRNLALINQLEATKYTSASSGAEAASGFFHRSEAEANLQTEINRASAVSQQRQQFRGVDYNTALSGFTGDLSKFDQIYQAAQQQTSVLQTVSTQLSNSGLFPIAGPKT